MVKKFWLIILLIVFLDQLTKFFIYFFKPSIKMPILNIIFVKNSGGLFGFFQGSNLIILILMSIIIFFLIKYQKTNPFIFGLITGGAIGNLIDRIFHGYVVDFLDFHILNYNYPSFNFADSFIVIGVLLLFFFEEKKSSLRKSGKRHSK